MHGLDGSPLRWRALRLLTDLSALALAWYGAVLLRIHIPLPLTRDLLPVDRIELLYPVAPVAVITQLLLLYLHGLYDRHEPLTAPLLARRLLSVVSLKGLILVAYLFFALHEFPRSVLVIYLVFDLALLYTFRLVLQRWDRPQGRRVALVGRGPAAQEIARNIQLHRWHGLEVVGHFPAPGDPPPPEGEGAELGPRLGSLDDAPRLLEEMSIDDLILAASAFGWQTELVDRLAAHRSPNASVLLLPGPFESLIGRMRYRWVHDIPLIEVVRRTEWRLRQPVKRLFDLVVGSLLVIASLPAMAVCALVVRLTSPGPVIYRQTRIGRGQRPFTLWKFRTMKRDAEENTGEVLALPHDPRLTPVGRLLRESRLDELPQLFNVMGGEMSLVGPRPERPGFSETYLQEVPGYAERFFLAPGITGLAQVNGDYYSSPENKLRYDLAYIANWSLWLDLSILLNTVKTVLTTKGT